MNEQAPTASTLFNYDSDRNPDPGLSLKKSSKDLDEGDLDKFQTWTIGPLKEPLVLRGDAYLTFFAAVKDFDQKKKASWTSSSGTTTGRGDTQSWARPP